MPRPFIVPRLTAILLLALTPAAAAPVPATPVAVVDDIYRVNYAGSAEGGVVFSDEGRRRFFTAEVAAAIRADAAEAAAANEVGKLDIDPFVVSNGCTYGSHTARLAAQAGNKASVAVVVRYAKDCIDPSVTIAYTMVRERGAWRVFDIASGGPKPDDRWSLRTALELR